MTSDPVVILNLVLTARLERPESDTVGSKDKRQF